MQIRPLGTLGYGVSELGFGGAAISGEGRGYGFGHIGDEQALSLLFAQGLGFALMEEMVWNGPRLANPTLMDYKVPTSLEVPYEIHSHIVEHAEPEGPFGAKGVGEIGINVIAAAVANALAAATGVRMQRLPMTPERVLRAMLDAERTGAAS